MGVTTDAILAYGYDLGGGEDDQWRFEQVDEWGGPKLDWFSVDYENESEEDAPDFVEVAQARLLAQLAGFTETDWEVEGYFGRKREAEKQLGVEFVGYCSDEFTLYMLAAHSITVNRGEVRMLDLAELQTMPQVGEWDRKLREACEALGITPTQATPGWILVSYWGG